MILWCWIFFLLSGLSSLWISAKFQLDCFSGFVNTESPRKKIDFSRSCMTLTFNPRSSKLVRSFDIVTKYVSVKYAKFIPLIQKLKKRARRGWGANERLNNKVNVWLSICVCVCMCLYFHPCEDYHLTTHQQSEDLKPLWGLTLGSSQRKFNRVLTWQVGVISQGFSLVLKRYCKVWLELHTPLGCAAPYSSHCGTV